MTLFVYVFYRMVRLFLGILGGLAVLFVAVDTLHRVGVVTKEEGLMGLLRYALCALPQSLMLIVPLGVLASAVAVWFMMESRYETVALKAGGVSVYRLFGPVFALCAVGGAVMFLGGEVLGEYAGEVMRRLRTDRTLKRAAVWDEGLGLVEALRYYPATAGMLHVRVLRFDDAGHLRERYTARKGRLEEGRLVLEGVILARFGEDGRPLGKPTRYRRVVLRTGVRPLDFDAQDRDVRTRTIFSLARLWQRYPYLFHLRVQFFGRIALLFAPFVLCVCGIPFSLWLRRRSVAHGAAAALAVAFGYMMLTMFLWEVGGRGQLSAVTAAWTPNLLFVALGASVIDLIRT